MDWLLIGALTRAYRSCSHGGAEGLIPTLAIVRVLVEAHTVADYPWRQLHRVIFYLRERRPTEGVWMLLCQLLQGTRCRSMWAVYKRLRAATRDVSERCQARLLVSSL